MPSLTFFYEKSKLNIFQILSINYLSILIIITMRVFTGKNLRRLEVPAPLMVFQKWGENYGSYQQQFMFYTTAIYFRVELMVVVICDSLVGTPAMHI